MSSAKIKFSKPKGEKRRFRFKSKNKIEKSDKKKFFTRKKLMALVLIGGIIFASVSVFLFTFGGNLFGLDDEIEWDVEEGDVYYFGIKDHYYYQNDEDDVIKTFRMCLRSEILEKEDLTIDWDNDDDLTIMSSFIFGNDDFATFEFPNWFDLYHILITLYNFNAMEEKPNFPNATELIQWATPNAIHFQTSSVYHELNSLISLFRLGIQSSPIEEFETLSEIIEWLSLQRNDLECDETIEDNIIGSIPQNFAYKTDYPNNNTLITSVDPLDNSKKVASMIQDINAFSNSKDDLQINFDLFSYFNNSGLGDSLDLPKHWYKPLEISFDLELKEDMEHQIYIAYKTDDFYITNGDDDFQGFNGIPINITNGNLYYGKAGEYVYKNNLHQWRKSLPSEKQWYNPSIPLDSLFFEGSPYGERMRITLLPDYDKYTYDLHITSVSNPSGLGILKFNNIKMHYDCPYDYMPESCYDYNTESNRFFRFNNMTNLFFDISHTETLPTNDTLDNIYIDGEIYFQTSNFERLLNDFYFSQLFLLSFYHTLFFPRNFDFDTLISISLVLNEIASFLFGISNFFVIDEEDDSLVIEIPYTTTNTMREKIGEFLLDTFGVQSNGFIEGHTEIKFTFAFDKRVDVLNESYITFQYHELGITRELGMELVACKNKDGEQKFKEYPAEPDDEWVGMEDVEELKQELIMIGIVACIVTGVSSSALSIGLIKLLKHLKERKKDKLLKTRSKKSKDIKISK